MKRILSIILLFVSIFTYSQVTMNPPIPESIHSPNASDLGKYGDTPVSLYTGKINIKIPIYQIKEGGIPLDINLQYDSSGVRVNSVPGWVGQNWSLNAGGVITRSVKGMSADEFDVTNGVNLSTLSAPNGYASYFNWSIGSAGSWPWTNQGYKNACSVLNNANWDSSTNLFNIWSNSNYGGSYGQGSESSKLWHPDLEPDIFNFNFMGHTGYFFMGQDGKWKVSSSSNLKVVCDFPQDLVVPAFTLRDIYTQTPYQDFPKVINNIKIMDDNGNQFYFGQRDATELTFQNFFDQHNTPITSTAWYLIYVKDKFDNLIYTFQYERGPYIGHFYLNYGAKYPSTDPETASSASPDNTENCDYTTIKAPGQLILPVYLKKITTNSGTVIDFNSSIANAMKFKIDDNPIFYTNKFFNNRLTRPGSYLQSNAFHFLVRELDFTTLNPELQNLNVIDGDQRILAGLKWKKLDNISIKDKNATSTITYNLDYDNVPERRLFLKSIVDNNNKKYSFGYYNDYLLPNFLSTAIDHLGYYNGHRFNFTCSRSSYTFWRNYKNERETNSELVKYGSLRRLTYPTGGFSEFEFEPHTFSKEIDNVGNLTSRTTDGIIGGLRIKQIIDNDGSGNLYKKEYIYKNDLNSTLSSGNSLFNATYFVENINIPNLSTLNYIDINPIINLSNLFGNTIEYETVIEKKTSAANSSISNGYTVYKYSNYLQFPDILLNTTAPAYNFHFPRTSKSFERGSLLEKKEFGDNNNLKRQTTYQYRSNQALKINAAEADFYFSSLQTAAPIIGAYQIYYTDKYISEEKEETFNSNGSIVNFKKYSRRIPELNSDVLANFGDLFTSTEYEEYSNKNGIAEGVLKTYKYPFDFTSSIYTNMSSLRNLPHIYEKNELVTGDPLNSNSSTIQSETQINYKEIVSGYGDLVQVPETFLTKKGANNFEPKFTFTKYDYKGNLLEYKTEDGISVSFIWGYNMTKIIAKIENCLYSSISASLINDIVNASSDNGSEIQLITASNSLRNHTSMSNAQITTYTYHPLFGINTITDPKGYISYYSYDTIGRLLNVKDSQGNILTENKYNYRPN